MKWLDQIAVRLLASPILWGGLVSGAFHLTLKKTTLKLPPWLIERLTGQWESYVCTTLFLIAVAFFVTRCIGLTIQFRAWQRFENDGLHGDDEKLAPLQQRLEALENDVWSKRSLLFRRLHDAQQFCARHDSASSLTTHLKELSDAGYDRLHADYGLLRTLTWAIPSSGSVATILAIAKVVEKLPSEASGDVLAGAAAGLSGAFNFFAFSVGLAIVLVAVKFALEQAEQLVLATIDKQVSLATAGEIVPQTAPPASQAIQFQQLTEVLKSVANSLSQQAQNGSRAMGAAPAASAGAPTKDIEAVVQTAIAAAMQRQPVASFGGGGGEATGIDSAGWKGLQHVLQKLAHVLEQQNAKLESEGRVTKQLTTIIDEGLKDTHPSLRIHDERRAA
ncbi:MAG TPA: hypothetical protein VGI40_04225 [Pirellulaceae bacterium]|jgi:hypothetical protein